MAAAVASSKRALSIFSAQTIATMADEEPMEAVTLATDEEKSEEVPVQQEQDDAPVNDPFALPEGDAADEPDEEEAPLTDTQKALENLKRSSIKLGSAIGSTASEIDQRVGITKAVEDIDNKVHASQTLKSATMALGGWLSSVDSQLGVSQMTKELGAALNERVVEPIKPTVIESTRNLQTFDETHGITRSTASTLAKGADMLTKSLVGDGSDSNATPPGDDGPSDWA